MDHITKAVKAFYEAHPFPASSVNSRKELDRRPAVRMLSSIIDQLFPDNDQRTLLDVGCGTGEITCGLAQSPRQIYGIDISHVSIRQASRLKKTLDLTTVSFQQGDIFSFRTKTTFDLVYAWGVLHHTKNPERAFARMVSMTKRGGYCIVALYYIHGSLARRIISTILRRLFAQQRQFQYWLARRLYNLGVYRREENRIIDAYFHPHELTFEISDACALFERHGIRVIGLAPPVSFGRLYVLFRDILRGRPLPESLARVALSNSRSRITPNIPELWIARLLWMVAGVEYFSVIGQRER